ncbi:MAG: hypothetical protein NVS4B8_24130 [Herpetosiphon sp.]
MVAVTIADVEPQVLAVGTDASALPLTADSFFIVASITKLATALAVLRFVDQGLLELDEELARYLPDAAAAQPGITLRRLLSHSAGLPPDITPDRAPYRPGLSWATLAAACLAEPPIALPNTVVQYGNVGYGLLAVLVERLAAIPFAEALSELVLQPLQIPGYLGAEPPRLPVRLSDVRGNDPPELESFNSPFYRSLAMPWSGLVTTATGALKLVRAFSGHPAGLVAPAILADACQNQTPGLSGGSDPPLWYPDCPWGCGPDIRGSKRPHWSPANAAPESFGHAGASGCLAWYDPPTATSYAICGTRTAANGWLIRHATTLAQTLVAQRAQQ